MIKLLEDYAIQVDGKQYTLGQMCKSENTGKEYFQPVGYYTNLENALVGFYRKLGQDRLSVKEEISLNKAIDILVATKNEVQALARETLIDIDTSELKVEKQTPTEKPKRTRKTKRE